MTSLKANNANEIAEEMSRFLGSEEYNSIFNKTASIKREAGAALEAYKKDLGLVKDENGLKSVWAKHTRALEIEENVEEGTINAAKKAQAAKARELGLPGYSVPFADDGQSALAAYKKDLGSVKDENGLKSVWAKHTKALEVEENKNEGTISAAKKAQAAKAKELGLPGYSVPFADDDDDDDEKECKCTCGKCRCKQCDCGDSCNDYNGEEIVAAKFTLGQLIKIADTLDKRGFKTIASVIDETILKIAKKKEEGEEKEKDKKKDKKEKKDKKKKKEKE
jgi:hypothetical protein